MSDDVGTGDHPGRGVHRRVPGGGARWEPEAAPDPLSPMWSAIAQVTGIGPHFIVGPSRIGGVVYARALAIRVMRRWYGMSWPAIAAVVDRRHSTVIELARRTAAGPDSSATWRGCRKFSMRRTDAVCVTGPQ